jgi:hypothetical protein
MRSLIATQRPTTMLFPGHTHVTLVQHANVEHEAYIVFVSRVHRLMTKTVAPMPMTFFQDETDITNASPREKD